MRLSDKVKVGSEEDLKTNLHYLADRLEKTASSLFKKNNIGLVCRVLPRFARATADQLKMLTQRFDDQIEISANICRSVFEINITLRFCLSDFQHLENFATQRVTDEISIYKNLKRLKTVGDNTQQITEINKHIDHLRSILAKHDRSSKTDRLSLMQMAKNVGLQNDYEALYGLYSKYVHASAWFVLGERDHIDLPVFRQIMWIHTQMYSADSLERLENYLLQETTEQSH